MAQLLEMWDELEIATSSQVSEVLEAEIVEQTGAVDHRAVRLEVKENRKLTPDEVAELVAAYQGCMSQSELARRFQLHDQTVRAHLKRAGVKLRPVRVFDEAQEDEVIRLYVQEEWSLAELADKFDVSFVAVRNVLVRRGVPRRPARPRRRVH